MSWVAAAVGGAAVLGAVSSNSQSKSAESAQKEQIAANERARAYNQQQLEKALAGMQNYYPVANQTRNAGYNAALGMIDQGYTGAGTVLNNSAQQYQNAIMGLPVDYSQLQAPQFNYPDMTTAFGQQQQNGGPRELQSGIKAGEVSNWDLMSRIDDPWFRTWQENHPEAKNRYRS